MIKLRREISNNNKNHSKQVLLIEVIELGTKICVNNEHSEKQNLPNELIEIEISIDCIFKS
jgi:hypothetical protein